MSKDDSKADGILQYILQHGRASRRQVGWLLGYIQRLREKVKEPQDTALS